MLFEFKALFGHTTKLTRIEFTGMTGHRYGSPKALYIGTDLHLEYVFIQTILSLRKHTNI